MEKINLQNLIPKELESLLEELGEKRFRAKQIFQWIHKGVGSIDEMTNLSIELRNRLKEISEIRKMKIAHKLVSKIDGTRKYLMELWDGNVIECVLMKYRHGNSICVSSQVGCRMGCKFCASTGIGFLRNLEAAEMLDQILVVENDIGERIGHVVMMGIGEPLDNYDNTVKFIRIVNHPDGINIGQRHISISTCGLLKEIMKLLDENLQITLSISLHATNDRIRNDIMPVNQAYSIDKIIEGCKIYSETTKRRITFEYAMIDGVNDSEEHARELARRLRKLLCHVNLIPMNEIGSDLLKKSKRENIEKFVNYLDKNGINATVRRELGSDINAACGQLRRSLIGE